MKKRRYLEPVYIPPLPNQYFRGGVCNITSDEDEAVPHNCGHQGCRVHPSVWYAWERQQLYNIPECFMYDSYEAYEKEKVEVDNIYPRPIANPEVKPDPISYTPANISEIAQSIRRTRWACPICLGQLSTIGMDMRYNTPILRCKQDGGVYTFDHILADLVRLRKRLKRFVRGHVCVLDSSCMAQTYSHVMAQVTLPDGRTFTGTGMAKYSTEDKKTVKDISRRQRKIKEMMPHTHALDTVLGTNGELQRLEDALSSLCQETIRHLRWNPERGLQIAFNRAKGDIFKQLSTIGFDPGPDYDTQDVLLLADASTLPFTLLERIGDNDPTILHPTRP